jgi:hypothetical protein
MPALLIRISIPPNLWSIDAIISLRPRNGVKTITPAAAVAAAATAFADEIIRLKWFEQCTMPDVRCSENQAIHQNQLKSIPN